MNNIKWILELLKKAKDENIYGVVSFKFENGKIITARIEKTEKPPAIDDQIK